MQPLKPHSESDKQVFWLFGRGLSIECGLNWIVPKYWKIFPRRVQIFLIKSLLKRLMSSTGVNIAPIKSFLDYLAVKTLPGFNHLFATTNWDYLLQRELLNLHLKFQPAWLANSHVYHLNGTVEKLQNERFRSPFLLEEDDKNFRTASLEANRVFADMVWGRIFIVVGMSFECETDRFLLQALSKVEDDLPIGESCWVVVNPDPKVLQEIRDRLQAALPRASVFTVSKKLSCWQKEDFQELRNKGVFV